MSILYPGYNNFTFIFLAMYDPVFRTRLRVEIVTHDCVCTQTKAAILGTTLTGHHLEQSHRVLKKATLNIISGKFIVGKRCTDEFQRSRII